MARAKLAKCFYQVNCVILLLLVNSVCCFYFDHAVDLDEDYRLLWSIKDQDITFEIQVRTLGYVGLGFSRDGTIYGADIVTGWVYKGEAIFQDRHVKKNDDKPVVDPSQDYVLLLGYENVTHTVLRFRRKLDTCDIAYDIPITNDTMRIIFMYHDDEPKGGPATPGSLPDPREAFKAVRPLILTQRVSQAPIRIDSKLKVMELKNSDVELPQGDDTLHWCKMFKMNDILRKHHLIRYEPVFETASSVQYLNHITLYECQGSSPEMEIMSRNTGEPCNQPGSVPIMCNAVVAAWSRGSEGFSFPEEAAYPLDSNQARFYLMETHYQDIQTNYGDWNSKSMADSSGLRIYYTSQLRKHDAGILSVGLVPNWRHIIPPGQERVVSEGHCIEECTQRSFPRQGINIFAVMMRTHQIGRQVRLRQIRGREELLPIAQDANIVANYQEYRRLAAPVKSYPGDRLIAECTYDSSDRGTITLGGVTTKEETCIVLTLYYPRQKDLTTCHSLPSLSTVLHSLGINELAVNSNPLSIASPSELAGMPLEQRLVTYDWKRNFQSFQSVTRRGSFRPHCWSAKNTYIPGTENMDAYSPNITRLWKHPATCSFAYNNNNSNNPNTRNRYVTESEINVDIPFIDDYDSNNIIEGAARSKVSRSSATESMGLSGVGSFRMYSADISILLIFSIFINAFRIS